MSRATQCQQIIDYMAEHGGITKADAMELGIWNLPGRILDLRKRFGHDAIVTKDVPNRSGTGTHGMYVWKPGARPTQLDLLAS